MAGNIYAKERAIVTVYTGTANLTNGSALDCGTFDCRTGGAAPDDFIGVFEWMCRWATVTGIVANTIVADLYLVPALDGTNYAQVDTSAGAAVMQPGTYVGSFINALASPSTATDYRFVTGQVTLAPVLYKAYLINRSGQTMSASNTATLKAVSAQAQYS